MKSPVFKTLMLVTFVLVTMFFCGLRSAAQEVSKESTGRDDRQYSLSGTEIRKLEREALRGVPEAALRLHFFYELEQKDPVESFYWARISAQNGDPMGQYEFGIMLSKDSDPKSRQRARFWLKKSAENGNEQAEHFLKSLPNY